MGVSLSGNVGAGGVDKSSNTVKSNSKLGFFEGIQDTMKKDSAIIRDAMDELGSTKTSTLLDQTGKKLHASSGNSFFKTMLKTAAYGGGLLAAADFLNPFSLGWND